MGFRLQRQVLPLFIFFILFSCTSVQQHNHYTTVQFSSQDGLPITADEYKISDKAPWMLLCHQARYSRGEYQQTALWFNHLGYNCLAIDQRSGNECNGVKNETAARAKEKNLPTEYLDAEQDIRAAIDYVFAKAHQPIILIGSSYSASLALKIASDNKRLKAVIVFSPGEYFGNQFRLKPVLSQITCPVLATSSKAEAATLSALLKGESIQQFTPQDDGIHGSSALWESTPGHEAYRKAVQEFLNHH